MRERGESKGEREEKLKKETEKRGREKGSG